MTLLSFAVTHQYPESQVGITLEVELRLGDESVRVAAKVDTGAEHCIFQRELGEDALKLDIEAGHRREFSTAIGQTFVAYGHTIGLRVLDHDCEGMVYFFEQPNARRNVLGRRHWLEQFRIAIVDYDRTIYLSPYDDQR